MYKWPQLASLHLQELYKASPRDAQLVQQWLRTNEPHVGDCLQLPTNTPMSVMPCTTKPYTCPT
eukprot:3792109-Karenia_brevis.AAC.1